MKVYSLERISLLTGLHRHSWGVSLLHWKQHYMEYMLIYAYQMSHQPAWLLGVFLPLRFQNEESQVSILHQENWRILVPKTWPPKSKNQKMLTTRLKFSEEAAQPDHPTKNTLRADQVPRTCSEVPIRSSVLTLKYQKTTREHHTIWKNLTRMMETNLGEIYGGKDPANKMTKKQKPQKK